MTEIAEMWRLPDKRVTKMDGSPAELRRVAIRQDNWIGFYQVLPDYGETISTIPEGSVPLILDGQWEEA